MVDQPSTATTPHSNLDTKTRLKSILGGSAGNLVEWYDWYVCRIYALFCSCIFPKRKSNRPTSSSCSYFCRVSYASHWRMDYGDLF
jgi:MHS family alpha-ketoglutarate permease-like MFS transporter